MRYPRSTHWRGYLLCFITAIATVVSAWALVILAWAIFHQ